MRFLVVYEKGQNNFSGYAPDVLGCISVGDTLEEMRANMIEALESHLEIMAQDGDLLPKPQTTRIDFHGEDAEHGVLFCVVEWLEIKMPLGKAAEIATQHEVQA
jgi:predicted RNase H-like HicB family nuclease